MPLPAFNEGCGWARWVFGLGKSRISSLYVSLLELFWGTWFMW